MLESHGVEMIMQFVEATTKKKVQESWPSTSFMELKMLPLWHLLLTLCCTFLTALQRIPIPFYYLSTFPHNALFTGIFCVLKRFFFIFVTKGMTKTILLCHLGIALPVCMGLFTTVVPFLSELNKPNWQPAFTIQIYK